MHITGMLLWTKKQMLGESIKQLSASVNARSARGARWPGSFWTTKAPVYKRQLMSAIFLISRLLSPRGSTFYLESSDRLAAPAT